MTLKPFVTGASAVDPEPKPTYRVIGVRDDGTRIQIDERLLVERANDLQLRLTVAETFDHVVVELEPTDLKAGGIRNAAWRASRADDDSEYNARDTAESN